MGTNCQTLSGLETHSLTVLEARSPRSRCWLGLLKAEDPREGPRLASSSFWGLPISSTWAACPASLHPLIKMPVGGFMPHCNTAEPHLNEVHLQRSHFQLKPFRGTSLVAQAVKNLPAKRKKVWAPKPIRFFPNLAGEAFELVPPLTRALFMTVPRNIPFLQRCPL